MTSLPLPPSMAANFDFLEHYIDSVDHLPLDVQRCISQLREYDLLYRSKLDQIGHLLSRYRNEGPSLDKRKILTKLQKCLIKSQQYGDEKLSIISQMSELVETRAQLVARDANLIDMDCKEEIVQNNVSNHRMKIEKPQRNHIEKTSKSLYDKPKRMRRVRDKFEEKNDKLKIDKDTLEENEEEELVDEEEVEQSRPKKEVKKGKEKDKVKDKGKEDKEEKNQEKKMDKNTKSSSGKVTKKYQNKQSAKLKKKKKKEKELSLEEIPVDPDEPTYCICSSISYGDMIGCDNDECQIEWFHFGCVNLTHKPKGKWYCPQCTIERKERNKK